MPRSRANDKPRFSSSDDLFADVQAAANIFSLDGLIKPSKDNQSIFYSYDLNCEWISVPLSSIIDVEYIREETCNDEQKHPFVRLFIKSDQRIENNYLRTISKLLTSIPEDIDALATLDLNVRVQVDGPAGPCTDVWFDRCYWARNRCKRRVKVHLGPWSTQLNPRQVFQFKNPCFTSYVGKTWAEFA